MPRRQPRLTTKVAVVIGVAAAVGALARPDAAVAEVDLVVELTAGYTDNLLRQPEGQDDVPASLGLTGTWVETTRHLSADVEGRVDGFKYFNDTFDDEVLGQLDGSLTWWAVPERLAWVVEDVYGQVAMDPFEPISPENRENTNFFSTGPDWYIDFGDRMRAYLGGRFGSVRYEITDTDSERLVGIVGIDRAVIEPGEKHPVHDRIEACHHQFSEFHIVPKGVYLGVGNINPVKERQSHEQHHRNQCNIFFRYGSAAGFV